MKKFILCVFMILPLLGNAQKIGAKSLVGIWQLATCEIAGGNLDTYQFFENGRFVFRPSGYDELKRIISITGYYKIAGDSLFLNADSTEEFVGGYPVPPSPPSGEWKLEGGGIKGMKVLKKDMEPGTFEHGVAISSCNTDTLTCPCILFEGTVFRRISSKP